MLYATLIIAISALLYGLLGYLGTRVLNENISIPTMSFWRFFIAACWMAIFSFRRYSYKRLAPEDVRTLCATFILGTIGYAGSCGFYFLASRTTGTGLAMVIYFSCPIIITLYAWVKNREFNLSIGIMLMAIIFGLLLLNNTSKSHELRGIFFALAAALCYAFYLLGSKHFSSTTLSPNVLTMTVCFGCSTLFLALALATHSFVVPKTMKIWSDIFSLAIFATALPIQLMLIGLKYVSSMRASIISVLEPLVTLLIGIILLHESMSHQQLLGAAIILSSAILVQLKKEL